jgi:Cu/Ag efflux pump CusA
MGGDNVIFWGPLAWTVIYGLIIATFLTLIIVPILFYFATILKMKIVGLLEQRKAKKSQ